LNEIPLLHRAIPVRSLELDLILAGHEPGQRSPNWATPSRGVGLQRIDIPHGLSRAFQNFRSHLFRCAAHIEGGHANEQAVAARERAH